MADPVYTYAAAGVVNILDMMKVIADYFAIQPRTSACLTVPTYQGWAEYIIGVDKAPTMEAPWADTTAIIRGLDGAASWQSMPIELENTSGSDQTIVGILTEFHNPYSDTWIPINYFTLSDPIIVPDGDSIEVAPAIIIGPCIC